MEKKEMSPQEKSALAMKALLNRKLHLRSLEMERQETYGSRTSADEDELREALTNGRVIWRRPGT